MKKPHFISLVLSFSVCQPMNVSIKLRLVSVCRCASRQFNKGNALQGRWLLQVENRSKKTLFPATITTLDRNKHYFLYYLFTSFLLPIQNCNVRQILKGIHSSRETHSLVVKKSLILRSCLTTISAAQVTIVCEGYLKVNCNFQQIIQLLQNQQNPLFYFLFILQPILSFYSPVKNVNNTSKKSSSGGGGCCFVCMWL